MVLALQTLCLTYTKRISKKAVVLGIMSNQFHSGI